MDLTPRAKNRLLKLNEEFEKGVGISRQEAMLKEFFNPVQLKTVDKWIAGQNDPAIDRLEAIRQRVEIGLKATPQRAAVRHKLK